MFNNRFIGKFGALEVFNFFFACGNFGIMLWEIYLAQQITDGGYYMAVDKSKLGYEIPKGNKATTAALIVPKGAELETLKAPKREMQTNLTRYRYHKNWASMINLIIITMVMSLISGLIGLLSFSL